MPDLYPDSDDWEPPTVEQIYKLAFDFDSPTPIDLTPSKPVLTSLDIATNHTTTGLPGPGGGRRDQYRQRKKAVKRIARFTFILAVMALTALTASSSFAQEAAAPSTTDFCWLDTTVRDVGEVPEACAENQQMIGLLCYDNCGVGKQRVGIDCHSVCPSGMADQGLYCRKSEYGRGAGYA